jgi:hypothetical protein
MLEVIGLAPAATTFYKHTKGAANAQYKAHFAHEAKR